MEYHRIVVPSSSSLSPLSSESLHWRSLSRSSTFTHSARIAHLQSVPPHHFTVCTSTSLLLYSSSSSSSDHDGNEGEGEGGMKIEKSMTKGKSVTLHCDARSDAKTFVVSGKDGTIRLVDLSSKRTLRTFVHSHLSLSVWAVKWCSNDFAHFSSVSDDRSVKIFDVASQECVWKRNDAHDEYIRMVDNAEWSDVIVTASLDGVVKYWDKRVNDDKASEVMTIHHGDAMSAMKVVQQDDRNAVQVEYHLVTAGESSLKAFDTRKVKNDSGSGVSASNKNISESVLSASPHQKNITAICLDSTKSRIITASLDAFVKVTSMQSFQVVASLKYNKPLLAMALGANNSALATGAGDGTLMFRCKAAVEAVEKKERKLRPGVRGYFTRGLKSEPNESDYLVPHIRKDYLKPYDSDLKRFHYHAAIDAALRSNHPGIIAAVLDELIDRNGLSIALSGRTDIMLNSLLSFLAGHFCHPQYSALCLDVTNAVLNMYGQMTGTSVLFDEWCATMSDRVGKELMTQEHAIQTKGISEAIWSARMSLQAEQDKIDQSRKEYSTVAIEEVENREEELENEVHPIEVPEVANLIQESGSTEQNAGMSQNEVENEKHGIAENGVNDLAKVKKRIRQQEKKSQKMKKTRLKT